MWSIAFVVGGGLCAQALMEAGDEWSTHKKCIPVDPRRCGVDVNVLSVFPWLKNYSNQCRAKYVDMSRFPCTALHCGFAPPLHEERARLVQPKSARAWSVRAPEALTNLDRTKWKALLFGWSTARRGHSPF